MSDEELSDEQAVEVEQDELDALKAVQERERNLSSVQVEDGGSAGTNWVTVDEDGNIINDKAMGGSKSGSAPTDRDLSPPRRGADQSPPRRGGGGGDVSPPRRAGGRGGGSRGGGDQSPPRRTTGGGGGTGGGDQSPPRRSGGGGVRKRHDSDSDQSPPRARAAPAASR